MAADTDIAIIGGGPVGAALALALRHSALRITLGHTTNEADLDRLVEALPGVYERALRAGLT